VAALLDVRHLTIEFPRPGNSGAAAPGALKAVRDLSISIAAGEVLGLVGESGSGKSVTSLALMRLLPPNARATGEVRFADGDSSIDLLQLSTRRCARCAVLNSPIFQEPMTALNPVMRVGDSCRGRSRPQSSRKRRPGSGPRCLGEVGIADFERRA
jgi:ABC-type glutathione transport system ATPase component